MISRSRLSLCCAGTLAAAFLGTDPLRASSLEEAFAPGRIAPQSAAQIVDRAFENLYGCDLEQALELVVRLDGKQIHGYEAKMARKHIGGAAHEVLHFVGVGEFRKLKLLRIERMDRSDDAFVYVPALINVRRISLAQRADTILGTNLTLEDLSAQWVDRFEVVARGRDFVEREPVHTIGVRPLRPVGYDRAELLIADLDYAILETRYYRKGAAEPFKVGRARRQWMRRSSGHVLPDRVVFETLDGLQTEIRYHRRSVNPELSDSLFSKSSLEGPLPLLRGKRPTPPEEAR